MKAFDIVDGSSSEIQPSPVSGWTDASLEQLDDETLEASSGGFEWDDPEEEDEDWDDDDDEDDDDFDDDDDY